MDYIKALTASQMKADIPDFRIGDTVRVYIKVKEGARERIQMFEGTVISKKRRRNFRDIHCSTRFLRRWRGEGLPAAFAQH